MRILVAVDGSHVSEDALEYALDNFGDSGSMTVAHVAVPELEWGGYYESWETAAGRGEAILESAEDLAEDHGVSISTELLEGDASDTILKGDASDTIADYVDEKGFDTVIVGHRGTTAKRGELLGSFAQDVVGNVGPGATVIVVRPKAKV